jgi:hypothetical protein
VSRRRRTPDERPARGRPQRQPEPTQEPRPPERPGWGLGISAAIALGVFVVVSLISWAAGAANLGVALGIGQVAFGVTIVALMLWR